MAGGVVSVASVRGHSRGERAAAMAGGPFIPTIWRITDMSAPSETRRDGATGAARISADRRPRRLSTETKAAFKTTEFFAFLGAVVAVLIAAAVIDNNDA